MREHDAMQASPEIDALVCRAEKGRIREHIEPCAQAFQDDDIASIGERADRRHDEEIDSRRTDSALIEKIAKRREAVHIVGRWKLPDRRRQVERAVDDGGKHA